MCNRAPPAMETEQSTDVPRTVSDLIEPFTLQIRQQGGNDIGRILWWSIAAVDENKPHYKERLEEQKFRVDFYDYDEALKKLTFQTDRDMVRNAIEIFHETYAWKKDSARPKAAVRISIWFLKDCVIHELYPGDMRSGSFSYHESCAIHWLGLTCCPCEGKQKKAS